MNEQEQNIITYLREHPDFSLPSPNCSPNCLWFIRKKASYL